MWKKSVKKNSAKKRKKSAQQDAMVFVLTWYCADICWSFLALVVCFHHPLLVCFATRTRTHLDQQLGQDIWTFIQHYYLLLIVYHWYLHIAFLQLQILSPDQHRFWPLQLLRHTLTLSRTSHRLHRPLLCWQEPGKNLVSLLESVRPHPPCSS